MRFFVGDDCCAFYFSILGGKGTSYLPSRGRYWLGVAEGCPSWYYTVSCDDLIHQVFRVPSAN